MGADERHSLDSAWILLIRCFRANDWYLLHGNSRRGDVDGLGWKQECGGGPIVPFSLMSSASFRRLRAPLFDLLSHGAIVPCGSDCAALCDDCARACWFVGARACALRRRAIPFPEAEGCPAANDQLLQAFEMSRANETSSRPWRPCTLTSGSFGMFVQDLLAAG